MNTVFAQDLDSILNHSPNQEALWSVTVMDTSGRILESIHSDALIIPASNQKLFTTAAVLNGLGGDFTYETILYGSGEKLDSGWDGDFVLVGSGDPSISGIMYNEERYHVFGSLVNQLKKKGISSYRGTLFGDVSYFDDQIYPKGWDWDDLSFYYGVEISPLSFNNNAVDLIVNADGEIGSSPEISWFPANTNYVEFINNQVIASPNTEYDEYYRRNLGTNTIVLGSSLPQGYLEKESLSVDNAPLFFLSSFADYLNQKGINSPDLSFSLINGKSDNEIDPESEKSDWEVLATHKSKPLSELIQWTNKESDNFYTEMLLKTLAAEKAGIPGTFENGIREVRSFLANMGIDTTYVVMKDGSGMASGNFTKTIILADFLVKMQHHPEFKAFYNSLSLAGIDGTIAYRMKGSPLYNNFKGKSGYVSGVRTLSGYFTSSSGKTLIVSMAANNFVGKVRPVDAVHEEILNYLFAKY